MTETISLILGAVLPPFIDLLTKKVTNSKLRFGISLLVCVVIGAVINIQSFKAGEILESLALVFTSSQVIYATYWKESALRSSKNK